MITQKLMIPKNKIEADKPAKQQTSFHRMERLVRRSLIALGIWSFMALWPWLSWRFFDGSLNISLSDRYILAIYLYALGFILHKALVKPCRKKTDPNVLANVGTEDGYITKRLAEIALRDDLWERNKHSLRGGFLQSEGQVRVECGDADVHVESSPNVLAHPRRDESLKTKQGRYRRRMERLVRLLLFHTERRCSSAFTSPKKSRRYRL
jgi:hypothetical protein